VAVGTGGAATTVTWLSSNVAAATVHANTGVLTTVAPGVTTITATSTFDVTISSSIVITVA
jgi:uncharacterized protein YjdB